MWAMQVCAEDLVLQFDCGLAPMIVEGLNEGYSAIGHTLCDGR